MKKLVCLLTAMVIGLCACGDDSTSTTSSAAEKETVAQDEIRTDEIYFFFSNGCPHCHEALTYINAKYPNLKMAMVNVANPEGYTLFVKCAQKFKLGNRIGTPLFCMGDNYLMGWADEYAPKFDAYVKPFLEGGQ